jgi:hypothetical protein
MVFRRSDLLSVMEISFPSKILRLIFLTLMKKNAEEPINKMLKMMDEIMELLFNL